MSPEKCALATNPNDEDYDDIFCSCVCIPDNITISTTSLIDIIYIKKFLWFISKLLSMIIFFLRYFNIYK